MKSLATRYNESKLRWRNVPLFLFKPIIEVGAFGETKYDTFNFLKGLSILDTLDALKRHLEKFENPYVSDFDDESLKHHLAHVAWNAIVMLHDLEHHPQLDDRYKDPKWQNQETKVKLNDTKVLLEVSKNELDNSPEISQEQKKNYPNGTMSDAVMMTQPQPQEPTPLQVAHPAHPVSQY